MHPALTVFLFALITALATGLGALPFLFGRLSVRWVGIANAIAAGLMGAASWSLVVEGVALDPGGTLLGLGLGVVFIALSHRALKDREVTWGGLDAGDAMKVLLILGVMTIHSFTEGVGVGVSFGGGQELGLYITAAIAVHNIPEGLAISLVMIPRGTSVARAGLWSIFSSLPQPLMAVPAFLLVSWFEPVLAPGLGFAAGAMLWMIVSELVPEAFRDAPRRSVIAALVVSVVAMLAFQRLL
ncbi:MAG TPA: ZIP family metal transporter [Longimicrobiales bacterium]|nr:ZIP family metal transporter [Longimicrobiales bacterium]